MASLEVLGVRIDNVTMEQVFERIRKAVREKRKLVITPVNIRVLEKAQENGELKEMLNQSDINTPDSKQLCYLAKLRKFEFAERVTGADIFARFPKFAARHGIKMGIFGGFGVAEKAGVRIQRETGAEVVFTCSPSPEEAVNTPEKIIERINTAKPDVLFVALGCPKQELWIKKYSRKVAPYVFVSIGAGLDFYAGRQKRAPLWMQRIGLEWMGRLFTNPKKMAFRYLAELKFYSEFLIETLQQKS